MSSDDDEDSTLITDGKDLQQTSQRGAERAYVVVIAGPGVGEMFRVGEEATIGRGSQAEVRILDDQISRRHARLLRTETSVWVEDLKSTNGTFVNGEPIDQRELSDGDKIQVGTTTILKFSYHDELEEQFQRQMYDSALRDGLTGAFNKKYLLERLETEFSYSSRHETPLTLLIFDIDHFKELNDTYGHLAGDHVLSTLANHVSQSIRKEDVFARYGGEEFVLVSRGIGEEGAQRLAERIRSSIEELSFEHGGSQLPVTVSVGVATAPHAQITDTTTLVGAADKALYAAKQAGRNLIKIYDGE